MVNLVKTFGSLAKLFSPSLKAAKDLTQNKGSYEQLKSMMIKNGAKADELEWSGADSFFEGKKVTKDEIHIIGNKKVKSMNIKTAPYPGFPTDLQAQMMVLLCKANKQSIIKEDIFENRFMHVAELNRMGAKISTNGNKAKVSGNINFEAAELMATDLRASVSLILAALTTKGKSVINRIYHLDRGYENIEKKLKKVGAKIRRVN